MKGIEVTLQRNKQFVAENSEDYKVVGSENNATSILVHFPEEYENYSKRVDFKNIKNEKWTIALYTPEDETKNYGIDFDKKNFVFTLPSAVTIKGELKVQFIAYLPDDTETFVPFEILKIEVKDDIMYVKKKGSQNPDLILKAYEYSNKALELARESLTRTIDAERASLEAEESAKKAEQSALESEQNSLESKKSADEANASAKKAEQSAKESETSAKNAEINAIQAKENSDYAVSISNTANEKSTNAVITANTANEESTKALDIVNNLTVTSQEINCTEHISVEIETDSSTKRKNIKFNVPAPKQGVSYRVRGPWEIETEYINNEFYIDTVSRHGCTYYCKISHTNQEPVASADSTYWGLMADKGTSVTIVDSLDSDHADYVLSARQGKELKTENDNQLTEINKIKNNTTTIANSEGGFSCGSGAINGKGMQFKNFTICDESGKIPVERLFDAIYPVGSIYMSTSATNPGILFGGTWEAFAQGRTIIGEGESDQAFIAGESGGESSHILNIEEMPLHTHSQNAHNHNNSIWIGEHNHKTYVKTRNNKAGISNDYGSTGDHVCGQVNGTKVNVNWASTDNSTPSYSISNSEQIAINNNTGGGNSHNNLPPFIVTYIWRRII